MTTRLIALLIITTLTFIQCKNNGDGSLMTPSGYEYVKTHSTGGATAKPGQFVYFEMDIKDDKGGILQSMRNLPEPQAAQIPGEGSVQEPNPIVDVLGSIAVGDTAKLTIPIDSMPGANPVIKENKFITYDLNVLEIVDKEVYDERIAQKRAEAEAKAIATQARVAEVAELVGETLKSYKNGSLKNVVKLPSGLEYYLHEKGTGEMPEVGQRITAHYYGVVKGDGSMFDNSFQKGKEFGFLLGKGQVIQGWDEGMAQFPKGSKATLFIPYDMAYGEAGRPPSIPQKADLVFYIELMD